MIPQPDTPTLPLRLPPRLKWLTKPSAVVSSKGERGKPSRGTSERRERRELETLWSLSSFKWKQLHRPPCPLSLSSFPLTSSPPSPYSPCHHVPPPSRSLSRSQCPPSATGELKECCSPTDSTTDSWFLYRWRINIPALQQGSGGAWEKVKKAVTMKLEYRGVNMKKDTVWNSCCILDSIKNVYCSNTQLLIRGNHSSGSSERNLLLRKLLIFFLWCVFWDQGKEEKVNYADVKSERHRKHFIYKTEFGGFLCIFFSFFVSESSVFEVKSLHWRLIFML